MLQSDMAKSVEVKVILTTLRQAKIIFWDFDGVIKDSVGIKALAFEQIFSQFGKEIALKIRQHHEAHGGVSRFIKIPLYLGWANQTGDDQQVKKYCDHFADLVFQAVIDAPWVNGVKEYLGQNYQRQKFILVTATPQEEIEKILKSLEINQYFIKVYGAPFSKDKAVKESLQKYELQNNDALLVGDSESDLKAANENDVRFILRKNEFNHHLQTTFTGLTFADLK